ncbi:5-methylthioadenosine/S-adenosylhomocysteine deaminase [Betaproteobacteria bacterium]|nr:5-methylthioadenosine/S-adenosylhomocysteine deaminase [Betaproteobacteria bacterium]
MSTPVDLLIHPRWLIPVEPERVVLEHHSVAVNQGAIVDILPRSDAIRRYQADELVDLPTHTLIPGLINLHTHAPMSLMRGVADDLPLDRWLNEVIWPAETRHVSAAFVRDGTLLAAREMLRGGITTCNDMYFFPDAAASAYADAGMRAVIGLIVIDFPSGWASDTDDYLGKGLAVYDQWREHPTLKFALAPHAPYSVSDHGLERVATLAAELDLPIHIHVHETAAEIHQALAASNTRPLARLARLGLLGPGLTAVHAVHLDDADLARLAHHGAHVAHCPSSNMKLASGIAPLATLLERGINVGLGTDGAASNNRLDLFQEMRQAALLAKVAQQNAAVVPAHQVLGMATLGGARALGLDDKIGSIVPGKRADLCAVDLSDPLFAPCFDPLSHLVYVCGREQVSHVWVDGKARVRDGKVMLQINDSELLAIAALWQTKLVHRAG